MSYFEKEGHKPLYQSYVVSESVLVALLKGVVRDRYDAKNTKFDLEIHRTHQKDDPYEVAIDLFDGDFEQEQIDMMMDEGLDIEDRYDTKNVLCFWAAGGSDAQLEYYSERNGENLYKFTTSSVTSYETQSLQLLELAINGTREETITALNAFHKSMKGR